jgi:hypothetical protein
MVINACPHQVARSALDLAPAIDELGYEGAFVGKGAHGRMCLDEALVGRHRKTLKLVVTYRDKPR